MRRALTFACAGETLAATLDAATGTTGLLIVTGGTQVRAGAHGGQARLAHAVAAAGYPAFRFDRRGIGDSTGDDPGYADSAADIAAAAAAFRVACPQLALIVGYGLCDAATALALHGSGAGVDALVLANPWVIEPVGDLPPAPAIRRHYARRLLSATAWRKLLTGRMDVRRAARGLRASVTPDDHSLVRAFAAGITATPTRLLVAEEDATAIAFGAALRRPGLASLAALPCERVASASHSFAGEADARWLAKQVTTALADAEARGRSLV